MRDAGSRCIQSQSSDATIVLRDVGLSDCNGDGLWARLSSIDVQGITLGTGLEDGIDLTGTSGQISGIQSSLFDGDYVVRMQSIEDGFLLEDSTIHPGNSGGVFAFMCEDIIMNNLTVTGAPGIDLDETSGEMNDIVLEGDGSGIGLTIRHGLSEPVVAEDIQISDYSVGIRLHAHDFEDPATAILRNMSIDSAEALSAELFDLRIESSSLNGDLSIAGSTVDAVDSTLTGAESIDASGLLNEWSSHSLHAVLNGEVVEASYVLSSDIMNEPLEFSGMFVDVELLYEQTTSDESTSITEVSAEVVSALSLQQIMCFPLDWVQNRMSSSHFSPMRLLHFPFNHLILGNDTWKQSPSRLP